MKIEKPILKLSLVHIDCVNGVGTVILTKPADETKNCFVGGL